MLYSKSSQDVTQIREKRRRRPEAPRGDFFTHHKSRNVTKKQSKRRLHWSR
nr:MAG TPA: hypothetical protein [Caudoviricetes sp.]